jgi:hypothetical protein
MTALHRPPGPGRVCPVDYRYDPRVFARDSEIETTSLYVAGGLYGNLPALAAVEAMALREPGAALVLNGDWHWFDAEPDWFDAVERIAMRHLGVRGNVETEIARGASEAGCGCAYPLSVDDATVVRSNAIMERLSAAAAVARDARRRLAGLPMHLVARVGPVRVGIVHGDAESLAGWRFDRAALDHLSQQPWLAQVRRHSGIDIFASAHTCAPVMRRFRFAGGDMAVANNGAAGMPNARGCRFGILTRIATTPAPVAPLYGTAVKGVHVDALRLPYDHEAFLAAFDACWPEDSPAAVSYRRRVVDGPDLDLASAAPDS